jgi:DNA repair protein RadD
MLTLRGYQDRGVRDILEGFAQIARLVAVAPTGSGKSIVAAWLIEYFVRQGKRCLFLAHRKELIDQISAILDFAGVPHGVIMAGHWRYRPDEPIQVASIDSLMSMRACPSCKGLPELIKTCNVCGGAGAERSRPLPMAEFIVIDEAHRAMGAQYQSLIAFYPHAQILLITATPWRLDGKGLGTIVKKMIVVADMRELIAQKHLLPIRLFRGPRPDLSGIKIQHGDYKADDVASVMRQTKITGNVVEHYLAEARHERGVVFACNVAHSMDLTRRFQESGVVAEHLDGTTPKAQREAILKRFALGETRVVSNVDVLTEGYDLPALHCVMLVRPTKSITRYLQWVGRGMRPFEDQEYCLVLDHAGCRWEHGRPDDFREWSLEDRRVTGRPKEKTVSEPEACPVCGLDLVRKICARCSPQLFSVMFTETDDRLVEDQPEQQTEIALHEPDRTVKKPQRVQRAKHGMALCNRCRETWVSVPVGKVVKVTCHKCLQQENRT